MQIVAEILNSWANKCNGLTWFYEWKTKLLNQSLGDATYNLFSVDLTEMFRTIQCLSDTKN